MPTIHRVDTGTSGKPRRFRLSRYAAACGVLAAALLLSFPATVVAAPGPGSGSGSSGSLAPPPSPPDPTTPPAPSSTTVSLTFDDGNADQLPAAHTLNQLGMPGTFFIISGSVGKPNYMTLEQVRGLAEAGNEIGGHTIAHRDLTSLSTDEAKREVCGDRSTLLNWGFDARNFAYPYAARDIATDRIIEGCGYNSARALGGVASPESCAGCRIAETIPPLDPYNTGALDQVDSSWTIGDLQGAVTRAEDNGGGWVQLTFHHVCDPVGPACPAGTAISPALFNDFVEWLAARPATTQVHTVGEVIGGPVRPAVAGPSTQAPGPGENGATNPGFEGMLGADGLPECWALVPYGENSATFSTTDESRSGGLAARLTMTEWSSGDAKLLPTLDLGECSTTVVPGRTYRLSAWYFTSGFTDSTHAQPVVYVRSNVGQWDNGHWGPWVEKSADYAQVVWDFTVPADGTAISFGMNIFGGPGALTTDDYAIHDLTAGPPKP